MTTENIYTDGITPEELRNKMRDLTRDTKDTHGVHDMRSAAWGLGLLAFQPIAESENVVADVMMTMPPGQEPKNGDTLIIPLRDDKFANVMIFDVEPMPGDWGTGDGFKVHAVQFNPKMAIGHEFNDKSVDLPGH
jgi:hypothetical protein